MNSFVVGIKCAWAGVMNPLFVCYSLQSQEKGDVSV